MKLPDLNVLIYAVDRSSPRHEISRRWLEGGLSGGETIGFAWAVLLGFVRLTTSAAVFQEPLGSAAALDIVSGWLRQPHAVTLEPGPRHLALLAELLSDAGTAGNLVTDAHLAALAIEHGAELVSYDYDFGRFPQLRWAQPPS